MVLQRFLLILACIIVTIIFALQGFAPQYSMPTADELKSGEVRTGGEPEKALSEIYFDVSIMGVEEVTPQKLESEFGIDPFIYTYCGGRYTNGRFGIADVIILYPRSGYEDEAREALQTIKLSRINLFKNYDIYNSHELAENGTISQRGGYYILTMIDNEEEVWNILEEYIPR